MYLKIMLLLLVSQVALARSPDGGGTLSVPYDSNERVFIEMALEKARANSEKLKTVKGPVLQAETSPPLFKWPMRESIVVTDPSVQAISGFFDHDNSEGGILDYDCGDRTYDGHKGLDIYLAPFSWYKMERDHGIVVAGAAGTITEKTNDQPERSCSIENPDGDNNLIVLEHADGSMSLYAHMRTGSLTAKPIGATVTAGEYLGVVGSSGMSSGPHLHFEVGSWVLESNQWTWVPRDPYTGNCNDTNDDSSWEEQPGYYNSALIAIATHSQPPEVPACPETESPFYSDRFSPGETLVLAAYYRDQLMGQNSHFRITRPNGSVMFEWDHSSPEEHYRSGYWYWNIDLPSNAPSGEWLVSVTFEGETLTHKFYVDASPEPAPVMPTSNNAYNGVWYDPSLDGEGYNIVTTGSGTVVYFYGSDVHGKRLWLISEVVTDVLLNGKDVTFVMYESTGGTYADPINSTRGLSVWGGLVYNFSDCNSGTAVLRGEDGEKSTNIVKIVGVAGTNCTGQPSEDGPLAGAWFDRNAEGEGYNIIVTPVGTVIYYYGFDKAGERLWLISGLIEETLRAGQQVETDVFKATAGTFSAPVPSDQALSRWGSLSLDVVDCTHFNITMDTTEGDKISTTVKIAGVVGLTCVD